jgi:hypothetical protein
LRWNWDSPLLVSSHQHTRIYFAANKLFRSDDRGGSWRAISGDLTRQLDRNQLPVFGKIWGPDAVAKNVSTSFYGNITALSESPLREQLLYVGTDDGLIQVTENGGGEWRRVEQFPGVPERTYVSRLLASQHGDNTVYASFDNHKNSDFNPYVLKSTDAGKTWKSIRGDLPANGPVLALAEDSVNSDVLFVGTEFGLYFTVDGGQKWIRLKSGLPTIAVRDLAIQKQQNDLVVGTFGRGIYVLDDYALLRQLRPETLEQPVVQFPTRPALLYIETRQYGPRGKAFQGAAFFTAANPPYGATFTYYLKEGLKTLKEQRLEAEKAALKKGEAIKYPSADELRAETDEEAPSILLTISDAGGRVLQTVTGPVGQGLHRVSWNLREPSASLPRARLAEAGEDVFFAPPQGPLAMPGVYRVFLSKRVRGQSTPLTEPQEFSVVVPGQEEANPEELKILHEFQQKIVRLQRAVAGTLEAANSLNDRLEQIKRALDHSPAIASNLQDVARALEKRNHEILRALRGDNTLRARNENVPISIAERVESIVESHRFSLAAPTGTEREDYAVASREFASELEKLRTLMETDLKPLEKALDVAGAAWTPGRLPEWKEK